ncbi:hypothetical protein O9992_08725 [Vibrio lentus]|nr:hypothetical protein [Vibrio lentus]
MKSLCLFFKSSSQRLKISIYRLKAVRTGNAAVVTMKKQYPGHAKRVMMGCMVFLTPTHVHQNLYWCAMKM